MSDEKNMSQEKSQNQLSRRDFLKFGFRAISSGLTVAAIGTGAAAHAAEDVGGSHTIGGNGDRRQSGEAQPRREDIFELESIQLSDESFNRLQELTNSGEIVSGVEGTNDGTFALSIPMRINEDNGRAVNLAVDLGTEVSTDFGLTLTMLRDKFATAVYNPGGTELIGPDSNAVNLYLRVDPTNRTVAAGLKITEPVHMYSQEFIPGTLCLFNLQDYRADRNNPGFKPLIPTANNTRIDIGRADRTLLDQLTMAGIPEEYLPRENSFVAYQHDPHTHQIVSILANGTAWTWPVESSVSPEATPTRELLPNQGGLVIPQATPGPEYLFAAPAPEAVTNQWEGVYFSASERGMDIIDPGYYHSWTENQVFIMGNFVGAVYQDQDNVNLSYVDINTGNEVIRLALGSNWNYGVSLVTEGAGGNLVYPRANSESTDLYSLEQFSQYIANNPGAPILIEFSPTYTDDQAVIDYRDSGRCDDRCQSLIGTMFATETGESLRAIASVPVTNEYSGNLPHRTIAAAGKMYIPASGVIE